MGENAAAIDALQEQVEHLGDRIDTLSDELRDVQEVIAGSPGGARAKWRITKHVVRHPSQ